MLSTLSIHSPLGELIALASETHLVMLEFADSKGLEKKLAVIARNHVNTSIQENTKSCLGAGSPHFASLIRDDGNNTILKETELQLGEYFAGTRKSFTLPLAPAGTDFQVKAWKALEKIPYGETRSYKEESVLAGNPKAVRAIGGANNKNPIVIIIPCHRVIGKSGKLVGYGGGIERKVWLLDHESKIRI